MKNREIEEYFRANADGKYREFHSKLVPDVDDILGVRLPAIKALAKKIAKENLDEYLGENYLDMYEKRMLRAMVIGSIKKPSLEELKGHIETFVPDIDNWAVCDCFCSALKSASMYRNDLLPLLLRYTTSDHVYEIRFGVVMLMNYYIDDEHIDLILKTYDGIKNEEYYVKMGIAWALSLCFVKQREKTLEYLKNSNLGKWTYNKAIQKINESFRVSKEDKEMLKKMKRK